MVALAPPLVVFTVVFAGVLGLTIGSFLNVVAYRVPRGIPLVRESRCPACGAHVRWWWNVPIVSWLLLRGRCAACRSPISPRYLVVELVTGLLFAAVTLWWIWRAGALTGSVPPQVASESATSFESAFRLIGDADGYAGGLIAQVFVLVAFLWFGASGVVQTAIDLEFRRLPSAITATGVLTSGGLLALACIAGADWWALVRAGAGLVALYAFYGLLALAVPRGMGGGDVKLASYVGLMLGWLGGWPLVLGGFAAFVLGGIYGAVLLLASRVKRGGHIPFGPWMIVGAWIGVVAGEEFGQWYSSLYGAS